MEHHLTTAALAYLQAGLSVIPTRRESKKPCVMWAKYQHQLPTADDWSDWQAMHADALAIITGRISGNLLMLDFDQGGKAFAAWRQRIPEALAERLVTATSQRGGRHVVFRMESDPPKSRKLASDEAGVLIETRGEGAYFLCAPTAGYTMISGDLEHLPVLNDEEVATLLDAAIADKAPAGSSPPERPAPLPVHIPDAFPSEDWDLSPGDDFNRRTDSRRFLEDHGWTFLEGKQGKDFYRRPGKTSGSSSGNFSFEYHALYVFSPNAVPLEAGKTYTLFALYALYDHGGDFRAAARTLIDRGYGKRKERLDAVASETMNFIVHGTQPETAETVEEPEEADDPGDSLYDDPGEFPPELMRVPGFVNELQEYINSVSHKLQPVLALGSAIAAQAILAGRNVCDETGALAAVYLLGIVDSGCGKSAGRDVVKRLFQEAERRLDCKGRDFTFIAERPDTYQGLEDWLESTGGSGGLLWDEIGKYLKGIVTSKNDHRSMLIGTILEMFKTADGSYQPGLTRRRHKPVNVNAPSLTIWGTSVPDAVWESFTREDLLNGLLGRILIMQGDNTPKRQTDVIRKPLPESLIEKAGHWLQRTVEMNSRCNEIPSFIEITYDDACRKILQPLYDKEEEKHTRNDNIIRTMWGRAVEYARRFAMIYLLSENRMPDIPGRLTMTQDAIRWGVKMAWYLTQKKIHLANRFIADTQVEKSRLKVLEYLKRKGGTSPKTRILRYQFGGDYKQCDFILDSLAMTKQVTLTEKNGGVTVTLIEKKKRK